MPASDSPALIVARYLKANNFTESYEVFISEAGLPSDAGNSSKGDLTLEQLLDEKKAFDISVRFEKLGIEDGTTGWKIPAPSLAHEVAAIPNTSNILCATVETVLQGEDDFQQLLLVSTADRFVYVLDPQTHELRESHSALHDSPVLSCTSVQSRFIATASMSGELHLSDINGSIWKKRRDHAKYIVKIATFHGPTETIVATAGWDGKILIYKNRASSLPQLDEPSAIISLTTKPEAIVFIQHPENANPVLLVTRTDSNFIFYYTVEQEPRLLGKQNLAPHSNTWVAFTPSSIALCPTDSTLLAVATSSLPHMKLLIVRLMVPPWDGATPVALPVGATRAPLLDNDDGPGRVTQASQARAALALADHEDAAIQIHSSTLAPQTAYSTPAVVWRPDGSGVWVNGDDGVIRGIEASSGRIVTSLHGHEAGSKVRCLWAGIISFDDGDDYEVLVSGGFDKKLIVWKV